MLECILVTGTSNHQPVEYIHIPSVEAITELIQVILHEDVFHNLYMQNYEKYLTLPNKIIWELGY